MNSELKCPKNLADATIKTIKTIKTNPKLNDATIYQSAVIK
jgi:hypothetical protein